MGAYGIMSNDNFSIGSLNAQHMSFLIQTTCQISEAPNKCNYNETEISLRCIARYMHICCCLYSYRSVLYQ